VLSDTPEGLHLDGAFVSHCSSTIVAVHAASGSRRAKGASLEMGADIFDLVQHSIVLCDRGGCVTQWNKASEQIYGWSQTAALGKPLHDLLKTRRETAPLIEHGLRESGSWESDVERRAANGVVKTIRLKRILSSPDEIVETGADITDKKRLEEALSRAEHNLALDLPIVRGDRV
jgi:PAS domain S-box-containing protein